MQAEFAKVIDAIGERLMEKGLYLATAESCTGGLVAGALTEMPGSSHWFERGFVTYSNASKMSCLNVDEQTLQRFGAVSEQVAKAMVLGAIEQSEAQVSVAVTGIAGPGGGTLEKPVGTVFFSWGREGHDVVSAHKLFMGDRYRIRHQAVAFALEGVLDLLG